MTNRQLFFAKYYVECSFNGAEAARRAGYSEKTARTSASRLLTNENVKAEIKKQIRKHLGDVEHLKLEWLNRVLEIVRTDPADKVSRQGVKLGSDYSDQIRALDLLGKFLSLFSETRVIEESTEEERMTREERQKRIVEMIQANPKLKQLIE